MLSNCENTAPPMEGAGSKGDSPEAPLSHRPHFINKLTDWNAKGKLRQVPLTPCRTDLVYELRGGKNLLKITVVKGTSAARPVYDRLIKFRYRYIAEVEEQEKRALTDPSFPLTHICENLLPSVTPQWLYEAVATLTINERAVFRIRPYPKDAPPPEEAIVRAKNIIVVAVELDEIWQRIDVTPHKYDKWCVAVKLGPGTGGAQYEDLGKIESVRPVAMSKVQLHFTLKAREFNTGKVFEKILDTRELMDGKPHEFTVDMGNELPCLDAAVRFAMAGQRMQIYSHPQYAFGLKPAQVPAFKEMRAANKADIMTYEDELLEKYSERPPVTYSYLLLDDNYKRIVEEDVLGDEQDTKLTKARKIYQQLSVRAVDKVEGEPDALEALDLSKYRKMLQERQSADGLPLDLRGSELILDNVEIIDVEKPRVPSSLRQEEQLTYAEEFRHLGNAAFNRGAYKRALRRYELALEACELGLQIQYRDQAYGAALRKSCCTLLINIAQVQHVMLKRNLACMAVDRALGLEPENVKALYRRAILLKENQEFHLAKSDIKRAIALQPSEPGLRRELHNIIEAEKEFEDRLRTKMRADQTLKVDHANRPKPCITQRLDPITEATAMTTRAMMQWKDEEKELRK